MKTKIALSCVAAASLFLVSCNGTTPQQNSALTGAAAGAAIGALAAGDGDRAEGALIGGAIGGVAGGVMGQNKRNQRPYYGPY